MIKKTEEVLSVEGLVINDPPSGDSEFSRRRIEIDRATGKISTVGPPQGSGDLVLDDDARIFPGLIDVHIHAREDVTGKESYKEDFGSAGRAAIHGGVTAVAEMPNNPVAPVDDDSYRDKRALTKSSPADVLLYAGIGPATSPLSFPVPYKAFMGPSVGQLFFRSDPELRDALARYRGHRVSFHAEAPEILDASKNEPTHARRRPPEAEIVAIERVLEMCDGFDIEANICHVSTAGGLEAIRDARARGQKVTCEVTPHHLYFDQDIAASFREPGFLQCNPPIRTRLDRIALLEGLKSGDIDYFATDHAPHTLEENERGISGMPHLDTFAPFLFWLRDEGVSWNAIFGACCRRPGELLSRYLPDLYGRVAEGFVGSLSVLRMSPTPVRRGHLETRAGWSPFEGVEFSGAASHTIVRGTLYTNEASD